MNHDRLRFETICTSIEPAILAEPGVNFTVRDEKGSYSLTLQKGADVATCIVDAKALHNVQGQDDLHGVAREALVRLVADWRKKHESSLMVSPLDDYHAAMSHRTTPSVNAAEKGEHRPDAQAQYPGPGRGTEPLHPSSKYDDGQINPSDKGQYHGVPATHVTGQEPQQGPVSKAHPDEDYSRDKSAAEHHAEAHPHGHDHKAGGHGATSPIADVAGNVPPKEPSSKYDEPINQNRRHPDSSHEENEGSKHNPRGTTGGRDGTAAGEDMSSDGKTSKGSHGGKHGK